MLGKDYSASHPPGHRAKRMNPPKPAMIVLPRRHGGQKIKNSICSINPLKSINNAALQHYILFIFAAQTGPLARPSNRARPATAAWFS
jgi:hypothetical protein